MDILELRINEKNLVSEKAKLKAVRIKNILGELKERGLPTDLIETINQIIEKLNSFEGDDKAVRSMLYKAESSILKQLEKDAGIVPKNHYMNQWMALGLAVFGVPIGVGLGTALGNMVFLGAGLPIGLSIGMVIGQQKDKEAAKMGK